MIETIAILLAVLLAVIAMLHGYWALGGQWPGHGDTPLHRIVIGRKGMTGMPPRWLTALVAAAILLAAIWPLLWAALIPYALPQTLIMLGVWALAAIFLLRGISGFTPAFSATLFDEPFHSLNRRYYSPLCLLIGAGFLALILLARL